MADDSCSSHASWQFNPIQPFLFEPSASESGSDNALDDQEWDISSECEAEGVEFGGRKENRDWCRCDQCAIMDTDEECCCCREFDDIISKCPNSCITEDRLFKLHCLNKDCLEMAYYAHAARKSLPNISIHKQYRYVAYRQFVLWIWHHLGKGRRVVLPSCVVLAIRKAFPSEEPYCGFKYPRLETK